MHVFQSEPHYLSITYIYIFIYQLQLGLCPVLSKKGIGTLTNIGS
jgi:hypothetical protein